MKINFEKILTHAEERLQRQAGVTTEEHLKLFKKFNKIEMQRLKMWHRYGASGFELVLGRSHLLDAIIHHVSKIADEEFREKETAPVTPLTILALGGYGRMEMNPFSDVDVMFVYPKKIDRYVDVVTNKVLYMLWDVGFQVGHCVRSISDAIRWGRGDIVSKTAMLESRYLTGSRDLYNQFRGKFQEQVLAKNKMMFVSFKAHELFERHNRHGTSTFVIEPDIKEGAGGLRDLHALLWIARVLFGASTLNDLREKGLLSEKEVKMLFNSYDFLLRVRSELHFLTSKKTDFLSLELQPKVAQGLGYKDKDAYTAVEVFMREYFFRTKDIQEIVLLYAKKWGIRPKLFYRLLKPFKRWKKEQDGFEIQYGEIYPSKESIFEEDPLRLIRLFRQYQKRNCELSEELKDLVRKYLTLIDKKYRQTYRGCRLFMELFSHTGRVGKTMRAMHETGFLGKYLPAFGRITCMVQYDFYHKYTTDEHILRVVDNLDRIANKEIPNGKNYEAILEEIENVPLLYLALLLHDIGKGLGGGHSHKGAEMSKEIARRFGLNEDEKARLIFLVEHHLTMAHLSQRRDINDEKLISVFAGVVKDTQNLKMLFLLTICDSIGTGSGVWTKWKEELLRQLYWRTLRELKEGPKTEQAELLEVKEKQSAYIKSRKSTILESQILEHFKSMPTKYINYASFDEITTHLKLVDQFKEEKLVLYWKESPDGYSVVTICTQDQPGIFNKITGTFSLSHINILSAQINTRLDGLILDTFYVCDRNFASVPSDPWQEKVKENLKKVLNGELNLDETLRNELEKLEKSKKKVGPQFSPKVKFDNFISESFTVIDVQGDDRLGFLYFITHAISSLKLSIFFAKIATEKTQAYDVFYVGDKNGKKIESEDLLQQIKKALEEALAEKSAQV